MLLNMLKKITLLTMMCFIVACGDNSSSKTDSLNTTEEADVKDEAEAESETEAEAETESEENTDVSNQVIATDGSLNILLIIGDDIGVDVISGYEEQPNFTAQTSTLDRLAKEGVLFRNAWANPMCSPSRASILTGRYAFRHGVTSPGSSNSSLPQSEDTLPELLSMTNITSALFGKWHLGRGTGNYPTEHGFEYYSGSMSNIENYFQWQKTQITSAEAAVQEITETKYATEVVAAEALNWILSQSTPWFAQVSFNAPHSPYHVPPESTYSSVNLLGDEGDVCTASSSNDDVKLCYRAAIESMDYHINNLISAIPQSTLNNTLIIFVGDNGTPGGVIIEEPGLPFSENHGKKTVYEGGVNVPLIIWGGSATGVDPSEVLDLVMIQDIFSTVVELSGQSDFSKLSVDGISLLGLIDNETDRLLSHEYQFTELRNDADGLNRWAITDGALKYLNNEGKQECYDLTNDPSEVNDLYVIDPQQGALCDELAFSKPAD